MNKSELHPDVRVGHVHLRVADLARATAFYRDVLGFDVTAYGPDFGLPGAAFLAAGGYHHHIGLNTWTSESGTPPPEGYTGLHHFAIVYPDRRELTTVHRDEERDGPDLGRKGVQVRPNSNDAEVGAAQGAGVQLQGDGGRRLADAVVVF